jgi:hypothetical protein
MVKRDTIDGAKVGQIVLIGNIIAMPSHNVKWGMILNEPSNYNSHILRELEETF